MIEGPILTILAVALYGMSHSYLASPSAKQTIAERFGARIFRGYRLGYNIIGLVTFLPVLAVPAIIPGDLIYQLSGPLLIVGFAGQALAALALVVGLVQTNLTEFLGLRQILSATERSESELVVKGLYRWVRHPLYSAGLLFIWLTPIMTTSVFALNLGLTIYIYIGSIFEERRLLREFGKVYAQYQRDVPRLVPRFFSSKRID